VARITVDVLRARPVDLAIIDGVETQTGGSGSLLDDGKRELRLVKPGLLVASRNPVCADAAAAALMGFDPMAARGAAPFERCDSTLELAESAGIGTRDLKRIEILGGRIADLRMAFRK
jgi:uncharacterized protein (DUF362 family)